MELIKSNKTGDSKVLDILEGFNIIDSISRINIIFFTKNINPGSYFLQSLLDGNPQIVVMPTYYNYSDILQLKDLSISPNEWFDLFVRNNLHPMMSELSIRNYVETDSNLYRIFKEISKRLIDNQENIKIAYDSMTNENNISFMDFLILINLSYALANKQNIKNIKSVFIPLHFLLTSLDKPNRGCQYYEGSFFQDILNDPRAKLLHILRDPRANYGSGVYSNNHGSRFCCYALLEIYRELHQSINIYNRFTPDKYYLIKNEDIHCNPKLTLSKLADWMGIEFNYKIISKSTICDIDWIGNSAHGKIDTFDNTLKSNKAWIKRISKSELIVIEFIVAKYFSNYNYIPINKKITIFNFLRHFILFLLFTDIRNTNHNSRIGNKYKILFISLKAFLISAIKLISEKKIYYTYISS